MRPRSTRLRNALDQTFQQHLPATFRGYSTNFSTPDAAGGNVRRMEPVAPGDAPSINHHIDIWSVDEFLRWELGVDAVDHLSMSDWLTFPEQKLLEVTAGAVYHDGLGQLVALREQLAYYPHDIWLYRLAAQWRRIAQEEAFVGRSGDVGDELGSQLVAARLVYDVMRLCFLLERRYAPYSKWWGTAFGRLPCAQDVGPQLGAVLAATTWQERRRAPRPRLRNRGERAECPRRGSASRSQLPTLFRATVPGHHGGPLCDCPHCGYRRSRRASDRRKFWSGRSAGSVGRQH